MIRLVVTAFLCLFVSGCSIVNSVRLLNANDSVHPTWNSQSGQEKLATSFIGEQMFVEASINGEPGFRFLVDTGASIPCLMTTEKVTALNLEKGYEIEIGGNGNEENSPAYTTELKQVAIGPVSFDDMTFCVIPVETTGYYLRKDEALFDGVIGTKLFDNYAIQVDAENNQVTIYQGDYPKHHQDVAVAMEKSWGKYTIEAGVSLNPKETKSVSMIVDSGSRNYIKLNKKLLEKLPVNTPLVTAADFGLSGRNIHQRAKISGIQIGDLRAKNIRANFIHDDDDDDITYVVGNGLLNQFVVTYDMPNEKLYLRKT
ncbi:MAG: retroviral-like aspartic protease family protein, partial [Kangiellaceae bacterium]|nr:retroviral-like aspartic protease family protein [Kangiellaceae bacterium]